MPGILIDVTRLLYWRLAGHIPTGIERVGLEYIRHYEDRARAVLSLGPLAAALSLGDSARFFRRLVEGTDSVASITVEMAAKSWLWNWIFPGTGNSILFNTSTLWLSQRAYATQIRLIGARPVFFIHDLLPISHPEYFPRGEKHFFLRGIRNALKICRGIVVNSRHTQTALSQCAREIGLPCPPTVVAPLAPSVVTAGASGAPPTDKPYFVCVGTIQPRKNHHLLLHLWRHLVEQQGAEAPRLYVVGQRGWECENVVDLLERCEQLKGFVFEDNACSDERLAAVLRHARALLMPSFAEGYGLPVAEALAAGVPVIASEVPAFREIGGDVPEYADPLDGQRWAELVREYARPGSARRAAQLDRMAAFRPTTWRQHFEIVDRFIEALP